jgi:hypothetical protein
MATRTHTRTLLATAGAVAAAAGLLAAPTANAAFGNPIQVSPREQAFFPATAMNARGDAVVVWLRGTGNRLALRASYRRAGGRFGAAQTVGAANQTLPGSPPMRPSVAIAANGTAYVTWLRSDRRGNRRVVAAVRRPSARRFGPVKVLSTAGSSSAGPIVELDGAGNALFLWARNQGSISRIQSRALSAGGRLSGIQTVSPSGVNADEPDVGFDRAGNAVAVWRFGQDGVQFASRPRGGRFGAVQTISRPSSFEDTPQVYVAPPTGEATIAWVEDSTDTIFTTQVPRGGQPGPIQQVGGVNSQSAEFALDGDAAGNATLLAVVTDNEQVSTALVAVRPAGGSEFGGQEQLARVSGQLVLDQPALAVNAAGRAYALFERDNPARAGGNLQVATRTTATGQFGTPQTVSRGGNAGYSAIAAGGGNRAIAAWELRTGPISTRGIAVALYR